jgi:hypothetical protein
VDLTSEAHAGLAAAIVKGAKLSVAGNAADILK